MGFTHLSREQLDAEKWDQCIQSSDHELVYAYSWYLDAVAGEWSAMVVGEYEAVFPLVHTKKGGIHYLYQPFFTQQLGLFSQKSSKISLDEVLNAIPKKYKLWDIQIHAGFQSSNFPIKERTTFHLSLNKSYDQVAADYNKDARKSIRKADATAWKLTETTALESIVLDYKQAYAAMNPEISERHYQGFLMALKEAQARNKVLGFVLEDESGKRMASAVFLKSKKYLHYVLGAPTPAGRNRNATHVLIDRVIQKFAQQNLILDFEGSEIPSVAYFYQKFGAQPHTYFHLYQNLLPWPLNWLKKSS